MEVKDPWLPGGIDSLEPTLHSYEVSSITASTKRKMDHSINEANL